jgi:type VI secretion system protein ImpC
MSNLQTNTVQDAAVEEVSLLDSIVEQSRIARNEEHDRAKSLIGELAKEVMAGTITVSENMSLSIDKRIAEIDALISKQLSKIMHMSNFRKLNRLGVVYITSVRSHLQIH